MRRTSLGRYIITHLPTIVSTEPKERADQLGICAGSGMTVNGLESGDWPFVRNGGVSDPLQVIEAIGSEQCMRA